MTDFPEKRSVISGIGISRIGRRTGISGIELTAESSRQAIADAGLTPADIDGLATMGDTPLDEAAPRARHRRRPQSVAWVAVVCWRR